MAYLSKNKQEAGRLPKVTCTLNIVVCSSDYKFECSWIKKDNYTLYFEIATNYWQFTYKEMFFPLVSLIF